MRKVDVTLFLYRYSVLSTAFIYTQCYSKKLIAYFVYEFKKAGQTPPGLIP